MKHNAMFASFKQACAQASDRCENNADRRGRRERPMARWALNVIKETD